MLGQPEQRERYLSAPITVALSCGQLDLAGYGTRKVAWI